MTRGLGRKPTLLQTLIGVVILSCTLVACGSGPEGPPDGDAGADGGDSAAGPANIPWLAEGAPPIAAPMLTPCPEGWHEVLEEDPGGGMDVVTCEPYGDTTEGTEPDTCPDGWAHFIGDTGCAPVGAPCPAGDFPEGMPADVPVLYVLSSALPGGDGTRGAPLVTITGAVNLASAGTVVAIGKGEYDEAVRVPPGVTLWGACAAETHLTASTWGLVAQGVLTIPSADIRLLNLRIGPADLPGIAVFGSRTSVLLEGVVIEGVRTAGLQVGRGARVDGSEVWIAGTRADDYGLLGRGVAATGASAVHLTRVAVSESRGVGVLAFGDGTSLTLSDALIRDTLARLSDRTGGQGLHVGGGATATITRSVLLRNRDLGVFAGGDGTSLTLSEVIVRDTRGLESNAEDGWGLLVRDGATAEVSRSVLTQNRDVNVSAHGMGTSLTLSDVVVEDTQAQDSDGMGGRGLVVHAGATVDVTRGVFSRNRDVAVIADGAGTSLSLSDVVARDTRAQESDGAAGRGLGVQSGATAAVTRAAFSRSHEVAVFASGGGTSLMLADVVARDTQGQESNGTGGRGLEVQMGATAAVNRVVLSRNRGVGMIALDLGTIARLTDVVVSQTREEACGATTCRDRPFGVGLVGTAEASLEATRFEVLEAAVCGVMVADYGQVDLSEGQVSGSQIGLCLQVEGYDVARLTEGVHYVDNGLNLDTTSLPVPEAVSTTGGAL